MMKALLLVPMLLSLRGDYCSGYEQGFKAAYCQGHGIACLSQAPTPPCVDVQDTWQKGYERGFDEGERVHPRHP